MWSLTGITYRIFITTLNIFFPPLAVMLLAGPEYDCLLNCALFLLAVIPSHVHGFYISCVYFHRRHKVRKGQYPGGPKTFIRSSNVLNGGATDREVERLYLKEKGIGRSGSRRGVSRSGTKRSGREGSTMGRAASRTRGGSPGVRGEGVARDGYGPPPPMQQQQQQQRGRQMWYP